MRQYLLPAALIAGGLGLALLPKFIGARITALMRIKKCNYATCNVTFTNTGNISWTFWGGLSGRDPTGKVHDVTAKSVTVAPGSSATISFPLFECVTDQMSHCFNVVGNWAFRASIWRVEPKPGTPESDRLADTGWKDNVVECYEEIPAARIDKAVIDSTQWYP